MTKHIKPIMYILIGALPASFLAFMSLLMLLSFKWQAVLFVLLVLSSTTALWLSAFDKSEIFSKKWILIIVFLIIGIALISPIASTYFYGLISGDSQHLIKYHEMIYLAYGPIIIALHYIISSIAKIASNKLFKFAQKTQLGTLQNNAETLNSKINLISKISNSVICIVLASLITVMFYLWNWNENQFISLLNHKASTEDHNLNLDEAVQGDWELVCSSHPYDGPMHLKKYNRTYEPVADAEDGAWGLIFIESDGDYFSMSGSIIDGFDFRKLACLPREKAKFKYDVKRKSWVPDVPAN